MSVHGDKKISAKVIAALGVVFGDIGTSPLYAFKECLHYGSGKEEVMGVLSLILWTLILLVSIKYIALVLRADNKGEGGILTLLSLAFPPGGQGKTFLTMTGVGLLGAAFLYGDGVITPAISVLSAVEGLKIISPAFHSVAVYIAVGILIALFSVQRYGAGALGGIFGIVILVWFAVLFLLGVSQVWKYPEIFLSINPLYAAAYLWGHPMVAIPVLGSVFLVVTGGEALYADMGHFGCKPIRIGWAFIVFPSLAMNYLGQGALVLTSPEKTENPFYMMAPPWALVPLVILATAATVIASQALISGAFSLTMQAVQMGYLPRMQILHTNQSEYGQIYIPQVNFILAVGCVLLVLAFGSSSALAAAYGIAVTLTMIATTTLFYFAARKLWNWNFLLAGSVCACFLLVEVSFFASNLLKIMSGGWFSVGMGLVVFYVMSTWKAGRAYIRKNMTNALGRLEDFIESIAMSGVLNPAYAPHRIKGTAVFLSSVSDATPNAIVSNLTHNKVLHERNIVMSITPAPIPYVPKSERVRVTKMSHGFYQVQAKFGFMEVPNADDVMEACKLKALPIDPERSTFFLGREAIVSARKGGLPFYRRTLFVALSRNAQNAAEFFKLPPGRTIEIGRQVEV